jgi:hypothetical protein
MLFQVDEFTEILQKDPRWMGFGMELLMLTVNHIMNQTETELEKYESSYNLKGYLTANETDNFHTRVDMGLIPMLNHVWQTLYNQVIFRNQYKIV